MDDQFYLGESIFPNLYTNMTQEEYLQLTDDVMNIIKKELEIDPAFQKDFEDDLEEQFRKLPQHENTILVLTGIRGFADYCETNQSIKPYLSDHAIHDVIECIRHYKEAWFSPRLKMFAE